MLLVILIQCGWLLIDDYDSYSSRHATVSHLNRLIGDAMRLQERSIVPMRRYQQILAEDRQFSREV